MKKILLVEDELAMAVGICDALEHHGFEAFHATDAEKGEYILKSNKIDLVVLDVMLPGKDGFEMCRTMRENGIEVPVIMLTARGEEIDKIIGLEIGADDYVTKPFSIRELIARIRACIRRTSDKHLIPEEYSFGDIRIDFQKQKIFKRKDHIKLTSTEFTILKLLIDERPKVITRESILNAVWGYTYYPDSRTVDTHILNLRKKIEQDPQNPKYIKTNHGLGYKFIE